jgi:tetratricopeptide (TPR) repeat protein
MKGIKDILQRYLEMESNGFEMYFDTDEIVELLDYFEEMDDFDHYENVLELGRKLHPESMDIKIRTCKMYIYHEQYEKALRMIEQIGDSENQDLNLLKMECFCALDCYGEVTNFIETQQMLQNEALEEIFEYLSPVLNELDRPEESYDFITRGLALFPDNLILKEELCYHMETQGQTRQALRLCSELIDRNPYSVDYWYMQGRLYFTAGNYDRAIEAFDFALTCDDSDAEIKILKAYCLFMNENYEKAIEVYLDLLSKEDEMDEHIQPLLAECYMKSDNFEQAYFLFKELLRNTDIAKELAICKNYIHCCLETEREQEATDALSLAVNRFPDDLLLLSLQAFVAVAKGEQEKTVGTVKRLLDMLCLTGSKQGKVPYLPLGWNMKSAINEIRDLMDTDTGMDFTHIHQAMKYLADGDMQSFCRQYEQCRPEIVAGYLNRMFQAGRQARPDRNRRMFLHPDEIRPDKRTVIAPDRLSLDYLTNKYHHN